MWTPGSIVATSVSTNGDPIKQIQTIITVSKWAPKITEIWSQTPLLFPVYGAKSEGKNAQKTVVVEA